MVLYPLMGILVRGSGLDLGPHPIGDGGKGGLGRPLGLTSVFPEHWYSRHQRYLVLQSPAHEEGFKGHDPMLEPQGHPKLCWGEGLWCHPVRLGGWCTKGLLVPSPCIRQGVAAITIMDLAIVARWKVCRSAVLLEEQWCSSMPLKPEDMYFRSMVELESR